MSSANSNSGQIRSLYLDHHRWLFGWLSKKLGCPHDAGDVSQDTFLKVLTADITQLREPRAYLLVVANRLLINRRRRKKVEDEVLQQVAQLMEQCDRRGPAEITAARDLLHQVLMMLSEELPEKSRKAFLLARVDGLSYRQIARKLAVSESSVKQYISRALVHCHQRLYDELIESSGV